MARVQINTKGGHGQILVDGERLVLIHGSEVETEATVTVPDKTRATLIRLGWTPPATDT